MRVAVQERRSGGVCWFGEIVALPVAPVSVALDAVLACLEFEVGELASSRTTSRSEAPMERRLATACAPRQGRPSTRSKGLAVSPEIAAVSVAARS